VTLDGLLPQRRVCRGGGCFLTCFGGAGVAAGLAPGFPGMVNGPAAWGYCGGRAAGRGQALFLRCWSGGGGVLAWRAGLAGEALAACGDGLEEVVAGGPEGELGVGEVAAVDDLGFRGGEGLVVPGADGGEGLTGGERSAALGLQPGGELVGAGLDPGPGRGLPLAEGGFLPPDPGGEPGDPGIEFPLVLPARGVQPGPGSPRGSRAGGPATGDTLTSH
jgi:hypothetical protein